MSIGPVSPSSKTKSRSTGHLRSRQADAGGVVHRLEHVVAQLGELGIELDDEVGGRALDHRAF
jgi:hypothetical protein